MIKSIRITQALLAGVLLTQPTTTLGLELTESKLIDMARGETPQGHALAIESQKSDLAASQFDERYELQGFSTLYYGRSQLPAAVPGTPTFSPTEGYEVGVRKYLSQGVTGSVSTFADQQSIDDTVTRSTAAGFKARIEVDLWKNLWGRLDQYEATNLATNRERAELQRAVQQRGFELAVRKVYWALVTNQESIDVTTEMLKSAEAQVVAAERRLRESVATKAEIARYKAQVSSRRATLTALAYQRETLVLQLKQLLPALGNEDIKLADYDLKTTTSEVLECTTVIGKEKKTPWAFTKYDDLVTLLEKGKQDKLAAIDRYDSADLKFFAEGETSGRGDEYKGGYEAFSDTNRTKYTVGLTLNIPLDDRRTRSRDKRRVLEETITSAERERLLAGANARHDRMLPMLKLLAEVSAARQDTSSDLSNAIAGSQQMYDQARISIDALINDQNALLANRLDELQTRQLVINELLTYFEVFTDVPCKLNQRG